MKHVNVTLHPAEKPEFYF